MAQMPKRQDYGQKNRAYKSSLARCDFVDITYERILLKPYTTASLFKYNLNTIHTWKINLNLQIQIFFKYNSDK